MVYDILRRVVDVYGASDPRYNDISTCVWRGFLCACTLRWTLFMVVRSGVLYCSRACAWGIARGVRMLKRDVPILFSGVLMYVFQKCS